MYPTKMEANGNIYNINTDFRVALACIKALNDEEISDLERFYAIETLLLGSNVKEEDELVLKEKIAIYLRCGEEKNVADSEVDMDYLQDYDEITTSIRSCYYNLNVDKMDYLHWWEFNKLIKGLSTDCLLNRIRDIRNIDLRDIKDKKERERIIRAKKQVALKKQQPKQNEEEKQSQDDFYRLLNGGE